MSLAQDILDSKSDLPTQLGSRALQQLRTLDAGVLRNSLLAARMTNADAVQGIRDAITRTLTSVDGKSTDNFADARLKLKALGAALNCDPAKGFPGDVDIPPAEEGSLRDLFSTDRLNLIFKTQMALTQGAAKNVWGNTPDAVDQYPAWELIRVEAREVPRGEIKRGKGVVEVPEDSWDQEGGRWQAACEDAGDDEALKIWQTTGRMIARKDSDVWQSLGDGAGGHDDGLGNDFEPFAFNSGMGRVEMSRDEFVAAGGDPDADVEPSDTEFGPDEVNVSKSRFDPDLLQAVKKEMESGESKFRVTLNVTSN